MQIEGQKGVLLQLQEAKAASAGGVTVQPVALRPRPDISKVLHHITDVRLNEDTHRVFQKSHV